VNAPRSQRGFTLVELMATLSVLGILAVIAVPSFAQMRQRAAVRGAAEATLSFWNEARMESIKRNRMVKVGVFVAADGQFCLGAATTEDPADETVCDCTGADPLANRCDVGRFPTDAGGWRGVTLARASLGGGDASDPRPAVLEPMRTALSESSDAGGIVLAGPQGPRRHELALAVDRLGRGHLCEPLATDDALPEYAGRRCAQ
jgi:prepilin-type N-terminal cleavage/methylation domain-containing protein